MAEFHISIPEGNILIEQPPVQVISRLMSNSKFYLVSGRWFLLSHSLTDDWVLAKHIHAIDYFWLSAYLGNSYLNSFRRKKGKRKRERERKKEKYKGDVCSLPLLLSWEGFPLLQAWRQWTDAQARSTSYSWCSVDSCTPSKSEAAKSKCGKYSLFTLPESLRENQKLIVTL